MTPRQSSSRSLDYYPGCPNCETNLPVVGAKGRRKPWECLRCGEVFDA